MYLIYDTETNKLGADACAVEVGAILLGPGFEVEDVYQTVVQLPPGATIDPRATAVHGYTDAMVKEGAAPAQVFERLYDMSRRAQWAIAFNNKFDIPVLGNLIKGYHPLRGLNHFCLMLGMTPVMKMPGFKRNEYRWPNLQVAHVWATGYSFDKAHSALADVEATARVLQWYVQKVGQLRPNNQQVEIEMRVLSKPYVGSSPVGSSPMDTNGVDVGSSPSDGGPAWDGPRDLDGDLVLGAVGAPVAPAPAPNPVCQVADPAQTLLPL